MERRRFGPFAACAPVVDGVVSKDEALWEDVTWGNILSAINTAAGFTCGPCSLDDDPIGLDDIQPASGDCGEVSSDCSSLSESDVGSELCDWFDSKFSDTDSDQDDPGELGSACAS